MVDPPIGGVMSPIADGATSLDLLLAAGGANVLVVGSYLGAVSHGLTALAVLVGRGRAPSAVVVSDRGRGDEPALDGTVALLREHLGDVPLLVAGRDRRDWAPPLLARMGYASVPTAS
jgi:dethiobiotin synthetase